MADPTKPTDYYIDAVGNIGIQAAIGRIELLRLEKVPVGNETPRYFVDGRLVMGLETLLRLYQGLSEVVTQLEEKGLVKKPEGSTTTTENQAAKKGSKK